jgi:hypothetical protein
MKMSLSGFLAITIVGIIISICVAFIVTVIKYGPPPGWPWEK